MVFNVNILMPTSIKSFLDSMSSLRSRRRTLTENTLFSGFSADLHRQKHPATVGGILISDELAAIIVGLEFAGLLYQMRFAGKSPGYVSLKSGRLTPIHRPGIGPASGSIYLQNMPLILPLLLSCPYGKLSLN
jgi:hypothetical protein